MTAPANLERLKRISLTLPSVELGASFDTPAFKVKGKSLAWLRDDGVRPNGWTYLLVRLDNASDADLHDLIVRVWRHEAPKRLVAEYDKAHPGEQS